MIVTRKALVPEKPEIVSVFSKMLVNIVANTYTMLWLHEERGQNLDEDRNDPHLMRMRMDDMVDVHRTVLQSSGRFFCSDKKLQRNPNLCIIESSCETAKKKFRNDSTHPGVAVDVRSS